LSTLFDSYNTFFKGIWPILASISNRGIPIAEDERLKLGALIEHEQIRVDDSIRSLVPPEVLSTKQKNGYKLPPILECEICHCKGRQDQLCLQGDGEIIPTLYSTLAESHGLVQREVTITGDKEKCTCKKKSRATCPVCNGTGIVPAGTVQLRWAAPVAFNPNSQQQVIRFMKFMKHPVPKHLKRVKADGSAADSTEVKELQRLFVKTKHPIYPLLIEKRQLTKMHGTYFEGYKPWADGRIHSTFTFQTATWQMSCCAGSTPVTTSRGVIPISEVKIGDRVWTHRNRWRLVTATWVHPATPMVTLHFSNGQDLTCTTAHRLLLTDHGYIKAMANGKEHSISPEADKGKGLPVESANGGGVPYDSAQHRVDSKEPSWRGRVSCGEGGSILPLEDRKEESDVRQTGGGDAKLEGRGERWVRVSDLLTGWEAPICASNRNGEGAGNSNPSEITRRSSYRREQAQQSSGQSCLDDTRGASGDARDYAPGVGEVQIEEVYPMGSLPVYDITVDEDESYESCGVFSHNSRAPNVQNSPVRGKTPFQKTLVNQFGRMLCASPGHTLVNFDYKSFHAQTTGCEAGLKDYLRLAKIDIHSFVACHFIHHPDRFHLLEMPDADLKAFFKKERKSPRIWTNGLTFNEIRNGKTKSCGLGIGFGMGPRKLYQLYQEDFASLHDAEGIWNLIMKELFPGLGRWQNEVRKKAAEQGFLMSRFGAMRRFYDVSHWDRKTQRMAPGEQAEAAVAFLPASNAFGMIRWGMLNIQKEGLFDRYELINTTHDSLLFDCPDSLVDECKSRIIPIMQSPCPLMVYPGVTGPEGLSVEADCETGHTKGDLH